MGGRRAAGRSDTARSKGAAAPAKDRSTRTTRSGKARTPVPPALPAPRAKAARTEPAKPKAPAKGAAPATKGRTAPPAKKKAAAEAPVTRTAKPASARPAPAKKAEASAPAKAATPRKAAKPPAPRAKAAAARLDDPAALVPTPAPRGASAPLTTPAPAPAAAAEPAPAPTTATLEDAPAVPKGPYADHTTDELWVLYRAEVQRLRAVDAAAEGAPDVDTEEELDEEAELRRLEAAALEEAAREAALMRGEQSDAPADETEPEVAHAPARRGAHSPVLERLRNELIERHYPLVRYIAERLLQTLPKSIELDDLISAGQFGLMDAIRGFDPSRGIKFKTYCSTRIRGSILDQLRSQDWVPRLVRLKATRIEKALQRLTGEYGREPTHAELARALELEHGELSREIMESQARTMFSLSEKWDDDDEGAVEKVEILEDRTAIDPVHELNRRDLMVFMTRSLTHKERFIIEQYYQYGHTMREIGEMLTLTESRVCQIHSNVMARLKSLLAQRGDALSG